MSRKVINGLFVIILLLTAGLTPALAQEETACMEEYTVQADDWLSKISAKFLGDVNAYPAIVEATNQQHAADSSFAQIDNPDMIEIGWKVCIPPAEEAGEMMAPAAEAAGELVVTDSLDRSISYEEPPRRIVIAGRATTLVADALYLFPEADDRLVGIEQRSQSGIDFQPLVDPNYDQKMALEMDAGPEQIAAANPDTVVLKSFMAERLGEPLEQLGLPVFYLDLETPAQYLSDIGSLGQLFNNPERAAEIQSFYRERIDWAAQVAAAVPEEQKPRVLVLQYSDRGGEVAFNVPSAAWLQTMMVEMAGGVPVWTEAAQAGGWTVVNFEQIAAWSPDQVYVIAYRSDSAQIVADLKADPNWQSLDAGQNDQLYGFPKDFYSWDQPDSRWILGLVWLTTKFHPDQTAEMEIMQEVNRFYTEMYNLDEATIQQEIMPILTGSLP